MKFKVGSIIQLGLTPDLLYLVLGFNIPGEYYRVHSLFKTSHVGRYKFNVSFVDVQGTLVSGIFVE